MVVTDSKCLYDHLHNVSAGPSKDRRTALDIAILRESMQDSQAFIRWVDGKRHQITDALTKRNGCADLLRGILQKGEFVVVEESRALQLREQERATRVTRRGPFGKLRASLNQQDDRSPCRA